MKYVLEVPQRILTGWGTVSNVGEQVSSLGKNALLLCSSRMSNSETIKEIIQQLEAREVSVHCAGTDSGEPTVESVEQILTEAEARDTDVVIGIGGGSVLDAAKAVAGLKFIGREPVKDYFYGLPPAHEGIPWVAVPTTSGTGAEATPNAVLSDEKYLKQSIRGDHSWLARVIVLDPKLTVSCPPTVTASSGMDALTQAIEAHTSKGANVLTEPYSLKAASLIAGSIDTAYREPANQDARTNMAYGSLLAGIALANARLGIVHGVAHSLGLLYDVPHGVVCGILLPWAIKYNEHASAVKYGELARAMGVGGNVNDLIAWVRNQNEKLAIPYSLKEVGLKPEHFPRIVKESMPSGSLKANPRTTSEEDLLQFLEVHLTTT